MPNDSETAPDTARTTASHQISQPIQIVSIVFYAGFAISLSIVAMAMFGLVGIGLAALFAWQWGRIPALSGRIALDDALDDAATTLGFNLKVASTQSSGNQSFDAYREALMQRLEKEQSQFEGFLVRLRDAKDKHQFDQFMDDHAKASRRGPQTDTETVGA